MFVSELRSHPVFINLASWIHLLYFIIEQENNYVSSLPTYIRPTHWLFIFGYYDCKKDIRTNIFKRHKFLELSMEAPAE